jgi:hypothetical protein
MWLTSCVKFDATHDAVPVQINGEILAEEIARKSQWLIVQRVTFDFGQSEMRSLLSSTGALLSDIDSMTMSAPTPE